MEKNLIDKLCKALLAYDAVETRNIAEEIISNGFSPIKAINALAETMKEIGDRFERLEIYLPEILLSADAMEAALTPLLKNLSAEDKPKVGIVIIGTVQGDVHDIGKNIIVVMLRIAGFEVYDLGKDCSISIFAEQAEKVNADMVAASAIMSPSLPVLKDLLNYLDALKIREKYKVIIGGPTVTKEYADRIGVDGYGNSYADAVRIANQLLGNMS